MSIVSLTRVKSISEVSFKSAIHKCVDLIELKLRPDIKNVAIKPNICSTEIVTNPSFVSAVIEVLRERIPNDLKICIVESDATAMKCRHAFEFFGYNKLAEKKDVVLVNLSEDKFQEIKLSDDRFSRFRLPKTLIDADLLVNVPVIKLHTPAEISCALKNIYGCNPEPKKSKYHNFLDDTILFLNKLIKSDVCIIDGVHVQSFKTVKLGLVMASEDPVAIDSVAAMILGKNPKRIRHIMTAYQEGLGDIKPTLKGDISYLKRCILRNKVSRVTNYFSRKIIRPIHHLFR